MLKYQFDTGPEGTALTAANTGGYAVVVSNGGTATFAAAMAQSGAFGAKFTANNGQAFERFPFDSTSLVQAFEGVLTTPDVTQASGDQNLATFVTTAAGAATMARLQWKQTGVLNFSDQGGAHALVVAAAGVLSLGTKYRVSILLGGNATTGAATVAIKVYLPTAAAGTTPVAQVSATNLNMATATSHFDLGHQGGIATLQSFGWDDVQSESGRTTEFGPLSTTNTAPVVTVASAQAHTTPTSTVTLTSTATDDGTIASRLWSFDSVPAGVTAPTITNGTTATASFVPATAGIYVVRMTATDNLGLTGSSTMTIYVAGDTATVIAVTSNAGAWTSTPSGSGLVSVLSDTDAATYAESPVSPATAALVRLRLGPLKVPTAFALTLGTPTLSGSGNLTFVARLYEGATLRKEWTGITAAGTDISLTLTTGEIATVTNWETLDVELSAVAA